ncbi:hypothetical protein MUO66_04665 [Candidatus Bathyarchaeota archaeon]|nr:hypothetical protein [Candidatus Bathyarchaeota archaeon]
MNLQYGIFIACSTKVLVVIPMTEGKRSFKNLLATYCCKIKSVDELWKWYDFSEKTGIASF